MNEFDQGQALAQVKEPSRPKKSGLNVGINIRVEEGTSLSDVLSKVEDIGEVQSLSINPAYDYDLY